MFYIFFLFEYILYILKHSILSTKLETILIYYKHWYKKYVVSGH